MFFCMVNRGGVTKEGFLAFSRKRTYFFFGTFQNIKIIQKYHEIFVGYLFFKYADDAGENEHSAEYFFEKLGGHGTCEYSAEKRADYSERTHQKRRSPQDLFLL